jgi:hypothetical protein
MQFMIMHKRTAEMEQRVPEPPPSPEELERIGALMAEASEAGIMVSGEGLHQSTHRVHLSYKGGQRTISPGPFPEARELIASFSLVQVRSRDEAIAWCDKLAAVLGDVELFVGLVVEMWDLGFAPKPDDALQRYLLMPQADPRTEGDTPLDAERQAKLRAVLDEMTAAGALQAQSELTSTRKGARLRFKRGGKPSVIDGPFAESKELIAGYAILELPSKESAVEWGLRWGEAVGVDEIDVRQLPE